MKLYAISGLGADQRVFQYLTLNCEFIPIDWITPEKNEPLEQYAMRLSEVIDRSGSFGILGVSFGGLVAVEISKQLKPALTILISSAETRAEIRPFFRKYGRWNLLKILPPKLILPPKFVADWFFDTDKKELLHSILKDTDLNFAKWAVIELTQWKNTEKLPNCLSIKGTRDRLMPPLETKDSIMIPQGTHFMVVDRAREISDLINQRIEQLTSNTH